jgi:hypothetical protein
MINGNTVALFQPDLAVEPVRRTRGLMPVVAGLGGAEASGVNLIGLAGLVAALFALEHFRPKG